MAFTFTTAEYGVKFPEIYSISDLEQVRRNKSVVVKVRRVNYTTDIVAGRFVYVLVGNLGEKMPHVRHNDSRWRLLDDDEYAWVPDQSPDGKSGATFTVKMDAIISMADDDSKEALWENICSAQVALYFMVVEKITTSYCGLTELAILPSQVSVSAVATKNGVLNNRWYSEKDKVWTTSFPNGLSPCRATVDLAQRLQSSQYRPDLRVVWVTASGGNSDSRIFALDYWTGRILASKPIANAGVEINALAVNPADGRVWYVVPHGRGSVTVCASVLNRSAGTITTPISTNITSPNARYTTKYQIFPNNMSQETMASRITGARVSAGPKVDANGQNVGGTSQWFTFIANMESTISVSMEHPSVVRWADRSHFGAWHGVNFSWGQRRYKYSNTSDKTKTSYEKDVEYGVDPNSNNINGICCGVLGGIYVNGHPYYHADDRIMASLRYSGYVLNDSSACGRVFKNKEVYYPSYVMDMATGKYKMQPNGKPEIAKKKINEVGHPVNGFHVAFVDDHTKYGWDVVIEVCGVKGAASRKPEGRHCRFGNPDGTGPSVDGTTAGNNFHGDSYANLRATNAAWGDINTHMSTGVEIVNEQSGRYWWQLQDLGIVYGGNAAMTNTSAMEYASGVSSGFPYSTSFYFSNGVCEDNPLQLSGCKMPDREKRVWYDHGANPPETGAIGVSVMVEDAGVGGFAYQKNRGEISRYFKAIVPDEQEVNRAKRPYSSFYGWAGWLDKPDSKYLYGSSEDWGVNKAGYVQGSARGDMKAYAEAGKPGGPRMSMCGIEETLPPNGKLASNDTDRKILQTDRDGMALYALAYKSDMTYKSGSDGNIQLGAALEPFEVQNLNVSGGSVFIDDENRVYVGSKNRMDMYSKIVDWDSVKYADSYFAEQFTTLGNHNNNGSRWNEAVLLWRRGAISAGETTTDLAREMSGSVITGLSGGPMYGADGFRSWQNSGWWGRMNCDPTGMDAVKTLGYCYTLKTVAHPNVVYPSGQLLIVEPPRRMDMGACDVDDPKGYWDKSVLEPSLVADVPDDATRRHIAEVVYPRDESAYEKASATIGTSAAAYQMATTKHLLDVYPSGSMIVRSGTLKYFDAGDQNRGYDKVEYDVNVGLSGKNGGYCAIYENPDRWVGATVFGKPLSTSADDTEPLKFYRWGQLTPSGDVWDMYPSVHPERYVSALAAVAGSQTDDVYVQYNEAGTSAGFVSPNYVEFWVRLDGDVYADEVRSELTDVQFGTNYIHLYERWSTPGFCPYVSSPESGKELFGVC